MEARRQYWLTNARITQYQGLLCENTRVRLEAVRTLNPATFLPIAEGASERDCLEVLEEVYSSRPDLRDRPLQNVDLFTNGSSFLDEGKRRARYAVVSNFETIEAQALPEGWSVQRAELWALLLEAVWEPKEIAVIHCKGHQKGKDAVSEGNQHAVAAAKLAAKEQAAPERIMLAPKLSEPPKYTPQEEKWAQKEGGKRTMEGWWILPNHRVYVPEQLAHKVVLQQHELIHLGKTALEALLGRYYLIACLPSLCASVSQRCFLCAQNNAKQGPVGPIGLQRSGQAPFEDLEVDSTKIGPSRGLVEAYPTCTEKAREVSKALLKYIIPQYRMPLTIGCKDRVTLHPAPHNQHKAYRPQSSGKVECMNWTLKQAMAKLCQETTLPWIDILPLVLLRVCCAPRARVGTAVHPYKPGDQVWVKDWKKEPLKPTWKVPYPVILTTPKALKVVGLNTWIHHSQVKAAHQSRTFYACGTTAYLCLPANWMGMPLNFRWYYKPEKLPTNLSERKKQDANPLVIDPIQQEAGRMLLSVSTSARAMGSSAAAGAAVVAAADSTQWLLVKEETIFLQDGPVRVTDLAELPSEILRAPVAADTDLEDFYDFPSYIQVL
ncbi:hypothetical protein QTO34_000576 [Cnephaeus nilssonii]|uniref:Murine leukemia virus integrase C-terminal domain-containing protein n=1 Tax=Cnephaeus nilssonii TaxID=3371016 RepID=A0AA40ICJ1_CNENI|nr:hypothetical protein QTO34_000576 [Eptesicus nilssonii]